MSYGVVGFVWIAFSFLGKVFGAVRVSFIKGIVEDEFVR